MPEIIDDDTSPPALSERLDCQSPASCRCPADEACHFEALARNVPEVRQDVEPPPRE